MRLMMLNSTFKTGTPPTLLSSQTLSAAFDGTNQYMNLGQPTDMNFNWDVDDYSVIIWFKPMRTNVYQCVIGKGYAATSHIEVFLGITDMGAAYLYLGGVSIQGSNGVITDNNWYMAAITASGGVGKLYINGVQQAGNISIGTETSTADWMVMCTRYANGDNAGDSFPTKGLVNNMAVWTTHCLSSGEVSYLYHSGTPVSPIDANLAVTADHWWTMGNDSSDYGLDSTPIVDTIGSADGTLTNTNTWGAGVPWEETPTHSAPTVWSHLPTTGAEWQFLADNFAATTNWVSTINSYTAVYANGGGSSVKQASSLPGASTIYEATVGDKFVMAANTVHGFDTGTDITIVYVYYTGALNGSGGFYLGSDDGGTSYAHIRLFNYFYAKDVGLWVYDDSLTQYEVVGANSVHANKYVIVHAVISGTQLRATTHVNGTRVSTVDLSPGTFLGASAAKFGIMTVGKEGVGVDYESTASGETFVEVIRYNSAMSARQIAVQAAKFNPIKGYV